MLNDARAVATPPQRKKRWSGAVVASSISALIAVAALVVATVVAFRQQAINLAVGVGSGLIANEQACVLYESWVIDRIHNGLSDQQIAALAPVDGPDGITLQTTASPLTNAAQSSAADIASFEALLQQQVGPTQRTYSPCGFDDIATLTSWIGGIRRDLSSATGTATTTG